MIFFIVQIQCGAAEKVPVQLPNGLTMPCEIVKVSKAGVVLSVDDKQQTLPLDKMKPYDVARCFKQVAKGSDAATRFDMGTFFFKNQLFEESEEELTAAVKMDESYKPKAAGLLAAITAFKEISQGGPMHGDKGGDKPADKSKGTGGIKPAVPGKTARMEDDDNEPNNEDFATKFKRAEVAPRSEAEMKKFLATRQEDLKSIGGTWRMIETKHFFCFSNVKETKHKMLSQWDESLYDRLCMVLKHKEGDKLWNNKCPIYYFEKYSQFQKFAGEIDESPGAAYSGGYFSAHGRDVHICIPFMTERLGEKAADRMASNTLHHEGTHAFLQLTGEDVPLSRALHEGMAQFIEFWYDKENTQGERENNPQKKHIADHLAEKAKSGNIPSWEEMKQRPMSGTDMWGYAWAWSKTEFLYRNFNNQCLPSMIRLVKSGKSEEEAIAAAFKTPIDKMEEYYHAWLKESAKHGFRNE